MKVKSGGGFRAIFYTFKKAGQAGGPIKLYKAMRSKNACKTCALGMGGQKGGMVNEVGAFPEVCKKSFQAMVADMQPGIPATFWAEKSIADLQRMSPRELETSGRFVQPILYTQGESHYRTITWKDAFERIATKLKSIKPNQSFWYFSGRSSNEAGFLLQLLARLYGTNNVNNCSYYCHQASGVGLQTSIGSGTATVQLEDLEKADLVFLIGGNPASNHPRLMTSLMHVRRRGGNVVVINPVRETGLVNFRIPSDMRSLFFGTKIASHYVMPHIGGDLALLWGLAKSLQETNQLDLAFLDKHCAGHEEWLRAVGELTWAEIEQKSGVRKSEIDQIAEVYAKAKNVIFSWTMGITHHAHGVNNVQAIASLAMARGKVGTPGSGLMPIRGHSNIQGIGSVGVTPKLKKQIFDSLTENYGLTLPESEGLDTMACIEGAADGSIKAGFCLGGNLYGSNPDSKFAAEALGSLDLNVMLSTTPNTGHAHGLAKETIVLPVLARDEEQQSTTQESMFNYIRLSDGGPRRLPGPRGEVEVIAELGSQLFAENSSLPPNGIDWESMRQTSTIRQWIAKVVPGFDKIAEIGQTKQEFQIAGRTFHSPNFGTPDGRAIMHVHTLPEIQGTAENQLRLMTVRSEGQFNTVVYEEADLYRNQDRRDIILMHPDDLSRLKIGHESLVTVRSETGEMHHIIARGYDDIRPGNALMYYPEANVLVGRQSDPHSRTPAFKCVVVEVTSTAVNPAYP